MIKNILLTFTLLGSMLASGQDAYQGHLWKISGNGLEKPSFLYGTMHVSNKVAFHLSDSFYKAIASVDVVALEINPEKWMETMTTDPYIADNYGNVFSIRGDYNRDGFYKSIFKLEEPENKDIGTGLSQELGILNSLLYRTSKLNADFQEDTYLDLFIYQAGKKQGKEITGLEQLGITMKLNEIAAKPEEDKKVRKALKKAAEKRRHVVTKLLDGKAYGEVMEDAYRRGDLEFLDSLSRMSSEVKSHDLIIVYRNKIMADNMDSIMQKKSLFAGVGAAHLANTYGMINLLREKGYTVTAVDRTKSDFGRDSKDKLEETFITQSFKNHQSFDGSFSLSMPGELYEFPESSNSMMAAYPDMPNGATYVITRMFTFAPLYGKTPEIYMEKIDSLLFENIPGKIISNDRIEIDGVPGFDIVNETKKGDFQRYHIMVTPIEIVIFKIGGKKEFAKRPEINQYFDNLKFHHKDGEWTTYTPRNNAYQVDMPGTLVYEGEGTEFMRGFWKKTVQSYDKKEGYFAVLNRSYSDWEYMEEDSFELSQMCRHFIEELEYTAVSKGVDSMGKYASYNVVATKDSVPNLYVRAVAKADQYYLIFGQTENKSSYDKFLNSFEFKDFEYSRKFEMKYDTARLFSVETNIRPPRERSYYRYYDDDDSDDSHESEEKSAVYYSKQTDEAIYTRYKKFHKYYGENHVDSIWKSNKERISENGSFVVYNEKKFQKDGMDYYDLEMGDTNTNRNFYARYIVKGGLMYSLFTETDKHRPKSKFVTTFFETFTPWDTIIGTDVIQNKTEMYLADLNSDDSTTREAAYNSWWKVNFEDEDAPKLISTYEKLYGNEHGIDLRRYILYKLGRLKHPQVVPFLEKKYEEIGDTMGFQIAILSSLAHQKTKKTSRSFAKLLLAETPLSSDGDDIEALFWPFYDSLSLAKELYPQVTMLTALSEYKGEVYNLLSRMFGTTGK